MCTIKQDPGKFEGETCVTQLMYHWAGEGVLDYADSEESEYQLMKTSGPFSTQEVKETEVKVCWECLADILGASGIYFWEDDNGFAYSEVG